MNKQNDTSQSNQDDQHTSLNPLIILLGILVLATAMTYFIESGSYQRQGENVVPDSYQQIEKEISIKALLRVSTENTGKAHQLDGYVNDHTRRSGTRCGFNLHGSYHWWYVWHIK